MKMIKSRIYEELQKEKKMKILKIKKKKDIGWGNQIRSYVCILINYQRFKK